MNALTGRAATPDTVPPSAELIRVSKVPRRVMLPEDAEWLADELTARLRKPRGTMRLRPVQAWSLYELGTVGGLFGPQTVGSGKTLVAMLAPVVMKSQRPLLIVPAGLVEKTKRDKEVLDQHWHLPLFLRIMSYEWLGREQAAKALEEWDPDLLVLDECHRARNSRGAAVARRITRFFRERNKRLERSIVVLGEALPWPGATPPTRPGFQPSSRPTLCAALSGTVTKRSLHDYAHILAWCLPARLLPIPTHHNDLALWADALDEKKNAVRRVDPGALEILCADENDRKLWLTDRVLAARRTYRRRLIETPGVVATYESQVDATLIVRGVKVEPGPKVDEAFEILHGWETPDGWSIPDAVTWARHARELALGFFYVWDPRPPVEWQRARSTWHKYVRSVLKHSRTHDSEKQVRNFALESSLKVADKAWHPYAKELASPPKDDTKRLLTSPEQRLACAAQLVAGLRASGKLKEPEIDGVVALFEWKGIQDTFVPNTVPVWIDSAACEFAAAWAAENAGIIWTEHKCFGERLRDEFGLAYYGRKGLDKNGKFIDDHDRTKSLVASRPANSEGRNLQGWCKNLITSFLPNGARNEQCLDARTEILSNQGWLSIDDIWDSKTRIAAYSAKDGSILWEKAKRIERRLGDEEMYGISNPHLDIRVTAGHRMLHQGIRRFGPSGRDGFEYKPWQFVEAKCLPQRGRLPIAGQQQSRGVELTDAELTFIGLFMSDGNRFRKVVSIFQSDRYPDIVELCERTFVECGFSSRKYRITSPTNFGERKHVLNRWDIPYKSWKKIEAYLHKDLTHLLEEMSRSQLEALLLGLWAGDGNKTKGTYEYDRYTAGTKTICSSRLLTVNRLQSLCVRRGLRCNVSKSDSVWLMHISEDTTWTLVHMAVGDCRPAWGQIAAATSERVWCAQVPTGAIVTRRNGKVAVVGNCIGRTHREGQFADEVEVEFIVSCGKHLAAFDQAMNDARYIESSTGAPQKLLIATVDVDEYALRGTGPRWKEEEE